MRLALAVSMFVCTVGGAAHAGPLTPNLDPTGILLAQAPPPPGYYQPQPPQQPYYQPQPYYQQPPTRAPQVAYEERPRTGLLIAGLILIGVGWTFDVAITSGSGHSPQWEAYVPVVGPLLQFGDSYGGPNDTQDDRNAIKAVANTFLAFDFILQGTGAALAIVGFTVKKRVVVYADGTEAPVEDVKVAVAPGGPGARFLVTW